MKKKRDQSPRPAFRNTKSKFYKKNTHDESGSDTSAEKNTGAYWKNKGNQALGKNDLQAAVEYYTKAIDLNPTESIFFSNRAKCLKMQNKNQQALKDAEEACELDESNIKAHYLCGCLLAEKSKKKQNSLEERIVLIGKAENRLKKALRLCSTLKKVEFIDSVSIKLFRVRKLKFFLEEEVEQSHIRSQYKLMKQAADKKLISQQNYESMMKTHAKMHARSDNEGILNIQSFKPKKKEIPDYMLCKITLQIMEEPMVTQAGFTYEKSAIEDHFQCNGMIEPITRKPTNGRLYSNQALKVAIQTFIEQNPWAFEYEPQETVADIQF